MRDLSLPGPAPLRARHPGCYSLPTGSQERCPRRRRQGPGALPSAQVQWQEFASEALLAASDASDASVQRLFTFSQLISALPLQALDAPGGAAPCCTTGAWPCSLAPCGLSHPCLWLRDPGASPTACASLLGQDQCGRGEVQRRASRPWFGCLCLCLGGPGSLDRAMPKASPKPPEFFFHTLLLPLAVPLSRTGPGPEKGVTVQESPTGWCWEALELARVVF